MTYPTCCPLVRFSHIGSIEDAARDGPCAHGKTMTRDTETGAFIMQVVDIGLSEIDAFSVQYARVFKPPGFRLMLDHSSNWPCEKEMDR